MQEYRDQNSYDIDFDSSSELPSPLERQIQASEDFDLLKGHDAGGLSIGGQDWRHLGWTIPRQSGASTQPLNDFKELERITEEESLQADLSGLTEMSMADLESHIAHMKARQAFYTRAPRLQTAQSRSPLKGDRRLCGVSSIDKENQSLGYLKNGAAQTSAETPELNCIGGAIKPGFEKETSITNNLSALTSSALLHQLGPSASTDGKLDVIAENVCQRYLDDQTQRLSRPVITIATESSDNPYKAPLRLLSQESENLAVTSRSIESRLADRRPTPNCEATEQTPRRASKNSASGRNLEDRKPRTTQSNFDGRLKYTLRLRDSLNIAKTYVGDVHTSGTGLQTAKAAPIPGLRTFNVSGKKQSPRKFDFTKKTLATSQHVSQALTAPRKDPQRSPLKLSIKKQRPSTNRDLAQVFNMYRK